VNASPCDSRETAPDSEPLGLALGGGGARAAYQVGVLRFLSRRFPHLNFPIVTGVSAGGINAALLASHHGSFQQATTELEGLWGSLHIQDVFRTDLRSLARHGLGWGHRLVSGGGTSRRQVQGVVDTAPLRSYLSEALHAVNGRLTGVDYNVASGRLRALALSTVSYTTGQSITWVQGCEIADWERPMRRSRQTEMTVEHVMASAALPLFFPAVQIGKQWYGDGGVRLVAPLSPALHLGARRILAISTRYPKTMPEGEEEMVQGYPPPAQILGVLMNAVFLDLLDTDALRLERLNNLLEQLPEVERGGLRPVDLKVLRPSVDLGKLAATYEADLPRGFRFLTRSLGTRETRSSDALSLILFQSDFLRRLMDIGEADAEGQAGELEVFFAREVSDEPTSVPSAPPQPAT
jgi:NTE family protein